MAVKWHERSDLRDKVIRWWIEGQSATEIASAVTPEVGTPVTRNAIIGLVSRAGLSNPRSGRRSVRSARAETRSAARQTPAAPVTKSKIPDRTEPMKPSAPAAPKRPAQVEPALWPNHLTPATFGAGYGFKVPVQIRSSGGCRWPVGDPLQNDFRHCGKEFHNRSPSGEMKTMPYCKEHCAVAYVVPPKKVKVRLDYSFAPSRGAPRYR
jgi:GcrA cell cycle regulator